MVVLDPPENDSHVAIVDVAEAQRTRIPPLWLPGPLIDAGGNALRSDCPFLKWLTTAGQSDDNHRYETSPNEQMI